MNDTSASDIIDFWFMDTDPAQWWKVDTIFDHAIEARYLGVMLQAAQGELFEWRSTPQGRLAEIIVLDQFSRNVWRNTPRAFSQDPIALVLSQEAVRSGALSELNPIERAFLLLPYMHSESRRVHEQAEILFREYAPADNYEFELKHKAIIDRFGRYPHRNEILGRTSSAEELEFLKQPGSRF